MKIFKIIVPTLLCLFMAAIVTAQNANTNAGDEPVRNPDGSYSTTKYNEAERPDDSNLAKFNAQDVVAKLMRRNLEQLHLIKIISTNFSDKGWDGEYNTCYEGYKKAVQYYYQRNMIYARHEFEINKKAINDLLKKITAEYEKDAKALLDESVDQVLALHFNEKVQADPAKSRHLVENQVRLRLAYVQYDDGCFYELLENYEAAIYYFRMAKSYGMKILEEFAKPEELDSVKQKYQVHKADSMNRIFNKSANADK